MDNNTCISLVSIDVEALREARVPASVSLSHLNKEPAIRFGLELVKQQESRSSVGNTVEYIVRDWLRNFYLQNPDYVALIKPLIDDEQEAKQRPAEVLQPATGVGQAAEPEVRDGGQGNQASDSGADQPDSGGDAKDEESV